MAGSVIPWWNSLKIRPEILNASGQIDDVQMSLGDAVYATGVTRPPYADVEHFGSITHPTPLLCDLLAKIAIRLAGGPSDYLKAHALTRLNQGMGGGKSHAEIAAWHMAENPSGFFQTDVGKAVQAAAKGILGHDLPNDLNNPRVVVLDLDKSTPGQTKKAVDGPFARNLYQRFLWRLLDGDANAYQQYQEFFNDKDMIGKALQHLERPVLIVIDEIMDYIGNGLTGVGDEQLTAQDMGFLRALLDVVNDVPNVAMLVAMIDPTKDRISLSSDGKKRQDDLNTLLDRNGKPATVNEDTDFTLILRRRLFSASPDLGLMKDTAKKFHSLMADRGWAKVFESLGTSWVQNWETEVERSYPFHPQLMHLAEQEWAKNSGYQNVRSTIRVFAATVFAWSQAAQTGWAPLLIGPGDLPLWDASVREALLGSGLISDSSLEQNYRSIFQGDITSLRGSDVRSGQAQQLDDTVTVTESWAHINPHAHVRAATMIAVTSLMPRGQGRRGAAEPEILVASSVPNVIYTAGDAEGVLDRLTEINSEQSMAAVEPLRVKGMRPRYYINPEIGVTVIYRQFRQSVAPQDRDDTIAETARSMTNSGPFNQVVFVDADRSLPTDEARRDIATETVAQAGLDQARSTRLVVLDPAGFSLRNGMGDATIAAVKTALGIGTTQLPVAWAASAVFVVVNTQRRKNVREAASEYLAWKRTLESPELSQNEAAKTTAQQHMREAHTQLEKSLKRAFQHILYLSQPTPDMPRALEEITLEQDAVTALDGTTVWKALGEHGRAFQPGEFTAKALMHNLRDQDYNKRLAEVRDDFWQVPRLPLLPGGEKDLRDAIYSAIDQGLIELREADGTTVAVDDPGSINLTSQGRRLAKPKSPEPCPKCGKPDCDGNCQSDPEPCPKCGKPGCKGDCDAACIKCGRTDCDGNCQTPPPTTSQHVRFTLTETVDAGNTGALTELVQALYSAVLGGDVSFLQGTVELVTSEEQASKIAEAVKGLGKVATVRNL